MKTITWPNVSISWPRVPRRDDFNWFVAEMTRNTSKTEFEPKRSDRLHVIGMQFVSRKRLIMMMSSNGYIFRVTGLLCGEFTANRWIPRAKTSDAEIWWVFFICAWTNSWANNGDASNLRRHRAHNDVIVMCRALFGWSTRIQVPVSCIHVHVNGLISAHGCACRSLANDKYITMTS